MAASPHIITARSLGLAFQNLFGELGPEEFVTAHYTSRHPQVGSRELVPFVRQAHREHKAKGWGGCGHHLYIAADGTIVGARPTLLEGAHLGGHNTKNLSVVCSGTLGDRPTA